MAAAVGRRVASFRILRFCVEGRAARVDGMAGPAVVPGRFVIFLFEVFRRLFMALWCMRAVDLLEILGDFGFLLVHFEVEGGNHLVHEVHFDARFWVGILGRRCSRVIWVQRSFEAYRVDAKFLVSC